MTEQQLRQHVCDIINGWIGATKGSAKHLEILQIYNEHKPLAVGYTVKPTDAYCATTVSAAWIKAGIAEYTGTECSVSRFTRIAQDKGTWVENDAYVPKLGDAIVYDWQDTGVGDNRGSGDHIGIVTQTGSSSFVVTEGNTSGGKVATRTMQVNGRYIRGFIAPDYAAIAKALGGATIPTENDPDKTTKSIEEIAKEVIAGKWGNGAERRARLQAAGYAYSAVQAKVNELLGKATEPTTEPTQPATEAPAQDTGKKVLPAEKFDRGIAGTYIVKAAAGLNIRYGPGTAYGVIKSISKGTKVNNYGYYSIRGGVKWYYIRCGATVGFVSSVYLTKA